MFENENDLTINDWKSNQENLSDEQCEELSSNPTEIIEIADEAADDVSGGILRSRFSQRRNKLKSLLTKPSPTIDFSSHKSLLNRGFNLP